MAVENWLVTMIEEMTFFIIYHDILLIIKSVKSKKLNTDCVFRMTQMANLRLSLSWLASEGNGKEQWVLKF